MRARGLSITHTAFWMRPRQGATKQWIRSPEASAIPRNSATKAGQSGRDNQPRFSGLHDPGGFGHGGYRVSLNCDRTIRTAARCKPDELQHRSSFR